MDDQKIENLLNLALDATQEERERSESLEVGYDSRDRTWQVIVRYSGALAPITADGAAGPWEVVTLSGGYAIVTLPQADIELLAALPEIEYIEKPKRLYFSVEQGRSASCMSSLQRVSDVQEILQRETPQRMTGEKEMSQRETLQRELSQRAAAGEEEMSQREALQRELPQRAAAGEEEMSQREALQRELPQRAAAGEEEMSRREALQRAVGGQEALLGQGVIIAVIDSGVDYFHPDFRNADGTTRILALWDQSAVRAEGVAPGSPPAGFLQGIEYTQEDINAALAAGSREQGYQIVPEQDLSGHGTEVLGIAAGNGRSSGGRYRGVAPLSDLLVVKLGNPSPDGFPRTTELMQAVEYVIRVAEELRMPVAVNMSFGNAYGSHRGTSLLETYLDRMADRWKSVFVVGTGNEAGSGGHVSGVLVPGQETVIELAVGEAEPSLDLQLWKNYADSFRVALMHPDGQIVGPFGQETGASRYRLGGTSLLVYYGEPSPYQVQQEVFFDFIPEREYLDAGVWRIILTPQRIVDGSYALWLQDSRARNPDTRFLRPTPDTTMTIPSSAGRVLAVGAYDSRTDAYAPFSGRGWPVGTYDIRPDLVAPGVDILTTAVRGGYLSVTGTSFATPFATGAAAMLMQWGIVQGNDPYLYGEKVKAYLRRGARALPGFTEYPNNQVGYGALCVRDSLPA